MVVDERRRGLLIWRHHFITDSWDWEAERVEWIPLGGIPRLVGKGDIVSGTSMAALLYALTEL
ncbi:hypothetical protein [Streptosporangium canum]|uniref:hypothetical protein n=1 Tax=Streptosporangium canum TaxID=324952 RepID=UPI0037A58D01